MNKAGVVPLAIIVQTMVCCGFDRMDIMLDDTPTRVQTTLKVDMRPIGTLRPKGVGEVSASRWTLDCAGMDREHADWRAVRKYVVPLGIARIRVQAGWARTEKDPGVYDFAWLDQIVYDAKRMGVSIWMELSYGNPSYKGGGGRQLSAGFPSSEEGLSAWDRWVEVMSKRYGDIVKDWCVWNEPDNKGSGNLPHVAANFAIRTAEIVKREIPDASIAAFALSHANIDFVEPFVIELEKRGKTDLFTSLAYHHYNYNPDNGYEQVEKCRAVIAEHAPNLKLWEGEGGVWSEWGAAGSLCKNPWSELTQAKYHLRRHLGDLGHGDDTEVFHICDLDYRTCPGHNGLVRYGIIKSAGMADGFRLLKLKMAYYAIQNVVSVFNDSLESLASGTTSTITGLVRGVVYDWRERKTGRPIVVFWDAHAIPSDMNVVKMADVTVESSKFAAPVWVDVLTGNAYEIPCEWIRESGGRTVYSVPAYDSPSFIADRASLDLDKSWLARFYEASRYPEFPLITNQD